MEKKIEKYTVQRVESRGGLCVKFAPLFFAGFPDRFALLPGGKIVFIEFKDTGKAPTELQARVHQRLRSLGFRVEVIDSLESANDFLLSI